MTTTTAPLFFEGNAYTLADDGRTLMAAPVLADGMTIDWDALAEVDVVSFDAEHLPEPTPPVYAWERSETDPCQAGTVGCAIDHQASIRDHSCEGW